ncbi:hypothetical protein [Curtobacterium herbarum]|uniref:Uncharacterized protein n=1 Tax=Curtobacterium herbarum TaxID=150122 RepID=A0ABP4KCC9_9MICO|nr:hypothetical protein [Curtobacterium herbarum]MBM7475874.1 hypothetical protein [Curtobacterium herbarum]MCS6543784.1 hypothetical protein [Curtobacterium herbarum]
MDEREAIARRTWRRTAVIAVVGLIVGGFVGWVIGHDDSPLLGALTTVGFALSFGGFAGAVSIVVSSIGISTKVRAPMQGLPRPDRRTIGRAIKTSAPIEPVGSKLGSRAVEQARVMAVYQPLALGQFLLLYLGLIGQQLPHLVRDDPSSVWISRTLCSLLVVVAVVTTPVLMRSSRRARRYVRLASA